MTEVIVEDLGTIEYKTAWEKQEALMKCGLETKAKRFGASAPEGRPIQNHLFVCTHPHVYTLGKSGAMEHLLIGEQRRKELAVSFYQTNRGGDITYHGPGQLVAYPILDLEQFFTDLGKYMRFLEEAVIQTLRHFGIESGRLQGSTGVWLDPETPTRARKICAMGVKCSRWITIHGLALNVNTNLDYFNYIVPCGISDKQVTSMEKELGGPVDEQKVKDVFLACFGKVFGATLLAAPAGSTRLTHSTEA